MLRAQAQGAALRCQGGVEVAERSVESIFQEWLGRLWLALLT